MTYYPKGHPKYKPDTRKRSGDRHKNKSEDRHKSKEDRHTDEYQRSSRKKNGFILVDGEGDTTTRIVGYSPTGDPIYEQLYVLLVASSGEFEYNENGVSTERSFEFLLNLSKNHPDKVLACYMGTYDTEMMLKDVPKEALKKMWEGRNNTPSRHPVQFTLSNGRDYAVSYLPRKGIYVRRNNIPPFREKGRDEYGYPILEENYDSVTLYDLYDFFQCRFVDALGDSRRGYFAKCVHEELIDGKYHEIIHWPDGSTTDLTNMKAMKNKRSSFTPDQRDEVIAYCKEEVAAMQRLAERLKDYLVEADLLPFQSKWHGPGACTNKLLHREGVIEHMREDMPWPVSSARELINTQLTAYSAGRMELGKFGVHIGKVYHYDLHSAFPAVMPELPSLTNGTWRRVDGITNMYYSVIHVQWDFDPGIPFFPFFYRDRYGGIYYPPTGEGWYWKPEFDAALKAWNDGKLSTDKWDGRFKVLNSWEFHPASNVKPFAFIPELYEKRRQWKEEENPAEKVLKFTINSIYGKLVQSKGWSLNEQEYIVKPTYHNIGWSGYITSRVRAQMFGAIMQSPENIIMVLIDGLCSTTKLDLPIGDGLGQWSENEYDGIISVQSGIYFTLEKLGREPTEREKQLEFFDSKFLYYGNEWFSVGTYYQGYNKGTITPKMVLDRWKDPDSDISPDTQSIVIPTRRFVTSASAMASEDLLPYWRTWRTVDRKLELLPTGKRYSKQLMLNQARAYERLVKTGADTPHSAMLGEMSYKYKPKWDTIDDGYGTIDGIPGMVFTQEVMDSEV